MIGNARLFQESITKELDSIKNRVRYLIGDKNWGDEGRFKEAVLKNVLRKFLPANFSVGTGFILKADGNNDADNVLSSQLDIIIYDNTYPVLFSEGDFVITTQNNIRAIIEVKSNLTHNSLRNAVIQLNGSIENFTPALRLSNIFSGVFSFGFEGGEIESPRIDEALLQVGGIVDHITLGSEFFIKRWDHADRRRLAEPVDCPRDFYNIYGLPNLSYSYFISNLMGRVCGNLNDRYWYSFPIEGTKERFRLRTVCL